MRKVLLGITSITLIVLVLTSGRFKEEWGFYGHKRINRMAVFTLPQDMIGFYKKNIEYITEHAVDPDKRRYATKHEGVRHYIDIDHWGEDPFNVVPKYLSEAVIKYCDLILYTSDGDTLHLLGNAFNHAALRPVEPDSGRYEDMFGNPVLFDYVAYSDFDGKDMVIKEDAMKIFGKEEYRIPMKTLDAFSKKHIMNLYYDDEWILDSATINPFLQEHGAIVNVRQAVVKDRFSKFGILPYNLLTYYNKLVRAFENGDEGRILRASAEIGHYLGDAHVPLHTTENYNGQLTNQDGIHGFWESRLPELFADETYNFWVGKAQYIEDPRAYIWNIVEESHSYVDSVLAIEKDLSFTFPQDKQYCFETRNTLTIRTQCKEYASAYHQRLAGMVEKRMTETVLAIGSVWFSAWVDAGQPKFQKKEQYVLTEEERKQLEEEEKMYKAGEIKGRNHSE